MRLCFSGTIHVGLSDIGSVAQAKGTDVHTTECKTAVGHVVTTFLYMCFLHYVYCCKQSFLNETRSFTNHTCSMIDFITLSGGVLSTPPERVVIIIDYKDASGLECDGVVHLRNGDYGLVEIKLGGNELIEKGAQTLKKLAGRIDTTKSKKPSFMMVLTAVGEVVYRREDGVYVVPITALK